MPSLLKRLPANRNFLTNTGFQMVVQKLPDTAFFVTKWDVPNITLNPAYSNNPFVKMPETGDKIEYEPLTIRYKINEDLSNYVELYTWIRQMGFSESHQEFKRIREQSEGFSDKCEISVFVLDSKKQPIVEFQFHEAFPIGVTGWNMDHGAGNVRTLEGTAIFTYATFSIYRMNEDLPVDNQVWGS